MSNQTLNTVLGTHTFGETALPKEQTIQGKPQDYIDLLLKYGFRDLDTAKAYGNSEHVIGQLKPEEQGLVVDTKVRSLEPGSHAPESIKESIKSSLQELNVKQIHILYLHVPDRATPFADTLKAIDESYREGAFQKFGLSNYTAEEVEQIVKICKENNYILPSVYQGNYNAITRNNEDKLFPLLRKEKISFYAYSPTAGGFFLQKPNVKPTPGSRWDPETFVGKLYSGLYAKPSYYQAIERVSAVADKYKLESIEAALRWIYFHSLLKPEHGDAVILGSTKLSQLESNLKYISKGPLPDEVVAVFEDIWKTIKPDAPAYHL